MDYTDLTGSRRDGFRSIEFRTRPAQMAKTISDAAVPVVPDYLQDVYRWAYLDERNARYLDHEIVVKTILWRQHRLLENAAFAEIEPAQSVLQAACVYGNFSRALRERIGPEGRLEVIDVSEVQVRNCRRKLIEFENVTVRHQDLLYLDNDSFDSVDAVCCYFLLHELPDDYKNGVTNALLNSVRPGGKVIFVDYHKPHWAHPLKIVTSLVFDTLEPFAKGLWHNEIVEFADQRDLFDWRKETYFGGLFQKVVATRRS